MKWLLILLGLVILCIVAVRWQGKQYQAFLERAEKTQGTVVKKETRTRRPNEQVGQENWVWYSYQVGGKTYEGQEKVEYADLWHDVSEGQAVDIYYDRNNPGISHPAAVLDRRLGIADKLSTIVR